MTACIRWAKDRLRTDDEGSALILALLILIVVGLIMSSLLSFAGTGLGFAPKEKQDRNLSAYTQGAIDAAIANIRGSSTFGRTGRPCPTYTAPTTTNADSPGADSHTYTVTCTPKPAVPGNVGPDQPDYAILALGTAAGEGIIQPSGGSNATLTIDGGIYSNGVITVDAGTGNTRNEMQVNGDAFAEGACTPARITTIGGGTFCNYNDTNHIGDDPQYAPAVASQADLTSLIGSAGADPTPTCAGSGRVEFSPGYYSVRPDQLVANTTPALVCKTANVYHFAPGIYVFDYNSLWNLGSPQAVTVVGGTLAPGWDGSTLGGACLPNSDGVQFIFGGSSRVQLASQGGIELCGPRSAQAFNGLPQRIALYGLSGNPNNGTWNPQDFRVPAGKLEATSAPTSTGPNAFSNPGNAQFLNETPVPLNATNLALGKNQTATLNYASIAGVPPGSTINSIKIRVGHTFVNTSTASVTLSTPTNPTAWSSPNNMSNTCTPYCEFNVPLASLGVPTWRGLNSLTATYQVTGPNNGIGTAAVDGLQLIVDYTPPALENQTCSGSGCLFWDSSVNLNVFFHGTVYVPSAAMSVNVQNKGGTIFDRGVIVRTITAYVSASSKQETSPFQIPHATPFGRRVLFTAYRDGDMTKPWARACVLFQDFVKFADGSSGGALPGYRAQVLHWSSLRSPSDQDPDCT